MKSSPTGFPPRLLKTKQGAAYLGISPWQLRRLISKGEIPIVQMGEGARFLVDVRDLDGYIERNKITRDGY